MRAARRDPRGGEIPMMQKQAGMFPESGVRASNMIQNKKDIITIEKWQGLSESSPCLLHKQERKNNGKITF